MFRSRHAVIGLGLTLVSLLPFSMPLAADLTAERQGQLERLLLQDCGSCHGMRLTGGLGPAITPGALAGKPRDTLIATVTYGRPDTAMPAWNALLSEREIVWLVDRLIEGKPTP